MMASRLADSPRALGPSLFARVVVRTGDIDEQKKKDIPFPFYRDSISLFQKDHDGGR